MRNGEKKGSRRSAPFSIFALILDVRQQESLAREGPRGMNNIDNWIIKGAARANVQLRRGSWGGCEMKILRDE